VPTALFVFFMIREYGDGKVASAVELVAGGLLLLGIYAAAAFALRVREVRELGLMIRTRAGR